MREVAADRFVASSPAALRRSLSPTALVEYEGSFAPRASRTDGDATVVTVAGGGLEFDLRFVETDDGWRYEQAGDRGPFDSMETTVTVEPANEGSRVRAVSRVSLGLPVPLVDRIAGWKRRGELRRLLDAVADDG
ncbi:SRPBCC family protein [Halobaculum sp. CBA1158]|uniref:SRPBCC family protein n=1 Tax=Halobaculum sp. CBA1158 TaxID=2904243 RepID=UPI001F3EFB46|nr:SRPBCC family protein [Halobaculum sp. CBA1158]UIP00054.1 SRPBCC family protein [Halobaculum sp. CBA1158]